MNSITNINTNSSTGNFRPFDVISVIGLGYIGLPTAAVIAAKGINVAGVDVNAPVVDTVNQGEIHIVEPNLDAIVKAAVKDGFLKAYTTPVIADAFMIAVPTPITKDKKADLRYVLKAGEAIAPVLKKGDLVILESTSPVGATETLVEAFTAARPELKFPILGESGTDVDVNVAYCPERVLPGKTVEELIANDRSIGGMTPACAQRAIALYRLFVEGELLATDARSAELCKLAENAYRDVNIAYANELANVCESLDMNVWEVIKLANHHPRVNILTPGPGVGGHCIAIDPWFIVETAPDDTPVIQVARHVNDARPHRVFGNIQSVCTRFEAQHGYAPKIALLGLAFKPDIDDLRESPSMTVAKLVADAGLGEIIVVEPNITKLPQKLEDKGVTLMAVNEALESVNVTVLLVDHKEFKRIPASEIQTDFLVDTRGLWGCVPI